LESISDYNEWNLKDKAAHLKASLVDGAATLLWQSKESSYKEIVAKLRARYGSAGQGEKFRLQLRCRRRRSGESPPEFAQEVERLTALAYMGAGLEMRDLLAGDVFIENLDNPGLTFKVRQREPATLQDAVTTVIKLETLMESRNQQKDIKPRLARAAQEATVTRLQPGQSTVKQDKLSKNNQTSKVSDIQGRRPAQPRQPEAEQQTTTPSHDTSKDIDDFRQRVDYLMAMLGSLPSSVTCVSYADAELQRSNVTD